MPKITTADAREYRSHIPTRHTMPEFDMEDNTVSFFLAYDYLRRTQWAEQTDLPKNMSYQVWGDDDLRQEWVVYVVTRTLQGAHVYKELIQCLVLSDMDQVADIVRDKAAPGKLHENTRLYPTYAENPYLIIPIPVPEPEPENKIKLEDMDDDDFVEDEVDDIDDLSADEIEEINELLES